MQLLFCYRQCTLYVVFNFNFNFEKSNWVNLVGFVISCAHLVSQFIDNCETKVTSASGKSLNFHPNPLLALHGGSSRGEPGLSNWHLWV